MPQRSGAEVVMLGMPGFVVLSASNDPDDGELVVVVQTTSGRVGCGSCGVVARSKGRRDVVVRDVPAFGQRARLVWRKRRWSCIETECETRSWTETHVSDH